MFGEVQLKLINKDAKCKYLILKLIFTSVG